MRLLFSSYLLFMESKVKTKKKHIPNNKEGKMCSQSSVGFQPTKKRKRKRQITILLIIVIFVTMAAMSCESTKPKPSINEPIIFNVESAEQWFETIEKIKENGEYHEYIINILDDFQLPHSTENTFGNTRNISVLIKGKHTISLGKYGTLLTIASNQNVTIEDVILQGVEEHDEPSPPHYSLVDAYGDFTMQGEAKITGGILGVYVYTGFYLKENASITNNIAGVTVEGQCFMSDNASISHNGSAVSVQYPMWAPWVLFEMSGGNISDNNKVITEPNERNTTGITIRGATFRMLGGSISGNMINNGTYLDGAVVTIYDHGSFLMYDGSISDNYSNGVRLISLLPPGEIFSDDDVIARQAHTALFHMRGGTIFGNKGEAGVVNDGDLSYIILSGGTIYGSIDTPDDLKNGDKAIKTRESEHPFIRYGNNYKVLPDRDGHEYYTRHTIIGKPGVLTELAPDDSIGLEKNNEIENKPIRSEQ